MRDRRRSSHRVFAPAVYWVFAAGVLCLSLAACGRAPVTVSAPPPTPATPDPHEQALIEHAVRDRLAEENRVTEQQLVNAREAASQRMVGRQMFLKLEEQYRELQAELSGNANVNPVETPVLLAQTQAQPSVSPAASASPQAPAPVDTAAKPDPKLQHPPVEDHADSMKANPADRATPTPSPTAPSASPNHSEDAKVSSSSPKPTATPK